MRPVATALALLAGGCLANNPDWGSGTEASAGTAGSGDVTSISASTGGSVGTSGPTTDEPDTEPGTTDDQGCVGEPTLVLANDLFSTQATEPEAVDSLTLPPSPNGWLLLVSAGMRVDTFGRAVLRYLVDGVVRDEASPLVTSSDVMMVPADSTAPWQSFDYVAASDASVEVAVDFRSTNDNAFATLLDFRLVALRIPDGADVQFEDNPAERIVDHGGNAYGLEQRLTLDPAEPAEYLVLGAITYNETPGVATVGARIVSPGPTYWPEPSSGARPYLANTQPPMHTAMWARAVVVPANPTNFDLEVDSSGEGGSTIAFVRMFAMRTDAFASFGGVLEPALVTLDPNTERTLASYEHVPDTPCGQFVVLQGVSPTGDGAKRVTFAGHTSVAMHHAYNAAQMRLVYTRFDRIDGGDPVAFDLTVQSDAVALDVREAFTYVIGP